MNVFVKEKGFGDFSITCNEILGYNKSAGIINPNKLFEHKLRIYIAPA